MKLYILKGATKILRFYLKMNELHLNITIKVTNVLNLSPLKIHQNHSHHLTIGDKNKTNGDTRWYNFQRFHQNDGISFFYE